MDNDASSKFIDDIAKAVGSAALELCDAARLSSGQSVVVGCSTSEIVGSRIGTNSNAEVGAVVFKTLYDVFSERGIYLAAQCCEHLNRAIIVEREAASGCGAVVNVRPVPSAGGAFATAAYEGFSSPVALEEFYADAGLDIGGTLIAMHLKRVAVPLRLNTTKIGNAAVAAARTRPKLIGGARAVYDERII